MVTTIQLNENVKSALDRLKSNKETYEEVILNLMKIVGRFLRRCDVTEHFSKTKNELYSLHQMLSSFFNVLTKGSFFH